MSQTRLGSFVESWANIAIGIVVAYLANLVFLPIFGFQISHSQNLQLTAIYTVISVIRSFLVRRLFNRIKQRWNHHG